MCAFSFSFFIFIGGLFKFVCCCCALRLCCVVGKKRDQLVFNVVLDQVSVYMCERGCGQGVGVEEVGKGVLLF